MLLFKEIKVVFILIATEEMTAQILLNSLIISYCIRETFEVVG